MKGLGRTHARLRVAVELRAVQHQDLVKMRRHGARRQQARK